jgi:hypothetical protein
MSLSPPIRRHSSTSSGSSSKREEDLINAYEAEEERIINVLSRKLEKVRLPSPLLIIVFLLTGAAAPSFKLQLGHQSSAPRRKDRA